MKHVLVACLLLGTSSFPFRGQACDLCHGYFGIGPLNNASRISLKYRESTLEGAHQHDHTHHHHGDDHSSSATSVEQYHTWELTLNAFVRPRLGVVVNMPIAYNYATEGQARTFEHSGLRDPSLWAQYAVLNNVEQERIVPQRMLLGAGLKAPMGAYDVKGTQGNVDPLLQAGTGSWDILGFISHQISYNRWGINTDVIYSLAGKNDRNYQFANRLNVTSVVYYQWPLGSPWNARINGGGYLETADHDQIEGELAINTGGTVLFSNIGVDFFRGNWNAGCSYQVPLYENLFGIQGINRHRILVQVTHQFTMKK